jgi:hypothetical protein
MGRIAGRFARVEPRRRVRNFVLGLLSDLPGKLLDDRGAGRGGQPGRHAASDGGPPAHAALQRLTATIR